MEAVPEESTQRRAASARVASTQPGSWRNAIDSPALRSPPRFERRHRPASSARIRRTLWAELEGADEWSCWATRSSFATARCRRRSTSRGRSSRSSPPRSATPGWWSCPETTTTTCWRSGSSNAGSTGRAARAGAADPGRVRPTCRARPRDRSGADRVGLPGAWLRAGVYATHGHFLDRHLTVPTFERLRSPPSSGCSAGRGTWRAPSCRPSRTGDRPPPTTTSGPRPRSTRSCSRWRRPAPRSDRLGGSNPSARVWQALGGGYGRAARVRGWLLGTVAVPGAVGVANRLGLGPVRSDLSPGAVTRAGLAAIGEVVHKLGIEADHLIFGHTHRRGPMRAESGGAWRTAPAFGTRAAGCTPLGCWAGPPPRAPTGPGR